MCENNTCRCIHNNSNTCSLHINHSPGGNAQMKVLEAPGVVLIVYMATGSIPTPRIDPIIRGHR